ncbi:hypothetical protein [Pseudonocardia alni]|nr:hypothetical protein [Pseudonocardia alni]
MDPAYAVRVLDALTDDQPPAPTTASSSLMAVAPSSITGRVCFR